MADKAYLDEGDGVRHQYSEGLRTDKARHAVVAHSERAEAVGAERIHEDIHYLHQDISVVEETLFHVLIILPYPQQEKAVGKQCDDDNGCDEFQQPFELFLVFHLY